MISAIIIDDEQGAQKELKSLINTHCKNVEIVGMGSSVDEAIALIDRLQPMVVFLDIEMPHSNGFNLLEHYDEYPFSVIFTTAYDEYAIKAIRFCALDYLLKPIQKNELIDAVNRVSRQKNATAPLKELSEKGLNEKNNIIILNSQNDFIRTKLTNIIRFEAERNYTFVFFRNGSKALMSKTLLFYDDLLEEKGFIRCHRSHLVNKEHVKKVVKQNQWALQLEDGSTIPVSHRKKNTVRKAISF